MKILLTLIFTINNFRAILLSKILLDYDLRIHLLSYLFLNFFIVTSETLPSGASPIWHLLASREQQQNLQAPCSPLQQARECCPTRGKRIKCRLLIPSVFERTQTKNQGYTPVVHLENDPPSSAKFLIPRAHDEVACTPVILVGIWFAVSLLNAIVTTTNDYYHARLVRTPKRLQRDVTKSVICLFIAVMYYMDIVRIPTKDDYWFENA